MARVQGAAVARGFAYDQQNRRVRVDGLRELRRDLKDLGDRDAMRELRRAIVSAADEITDLARVFSPIDTGELAAGFRSTTAGGVRAVVRNRVEYAGVHEWGGTIRPRGTAIRIDRSRMLGRAVHEGLDDFLDELADNLMAVARRRGWT